MIYIVEDDKSIRDLVVYAMESVGFEARGFEHPSEFYEAIENVIPDLVILDIMSPFRSSEKNPRGSDSIF